MNARMIATSRSYTKHEKRAYQQRILRRRVRIGASNAAFLAARFEPLINGMRAAAEGLRDAFGRLDAMPPVRPRKLEDILGPGDELVFNDEPLETLGEFTRRDHDQTFHGLRPLVDEMVHFNPDGSHQIGDIRAWTPDPRQGTRPPVSSPLREMLEEQANEIPIDEQFPEGWTRR